MTADAVFAGFPEEALDFYEGLVADNSKAYWTDHRAVYERAVRAPFAALLDALGPEFGEAKLFRPYRDVRFSKDKTPYKNHQGAVVGGETAALYVQLSAAGLLVAGGAWRLPTLQARRLRAAVADDLAGRQLIDLVDGLTAAGFEVDGERLRRVPPEHRGAPRQQWLTLKTLTARCEDPPSPGLHGPQTLDLVRDRWRRLLPLNAWLTRAVGGAPR